MSGSGFTLAIERSVRGGSSACIMNAAGEVVARSASADGDADGFDCAVRTAALLRESDISAADVARFLIGVGPGSFSGIRAALAFVAGMASPSGARIIGVPSSAAIAMAAFDSNPGRVAVVVAGDARRGATWLCSYRRLGGSIAMDGAMRVVKHTEVLGLIPAGAIVASAEPEALRRCAGEEIARLGCDAAVLPTAENIARVADSSPVLRVVPALPLYPHAAVL